MSAISPPESVEPKDFPPRSPGGQGHAWLNGLLAGVFLYFFLAAINVMGAGLKVMGKNTDWLEQVFELADNPFVALMGAVLVTAIVQSSSFTTSLIITLVGANQMPLDTAVFAIMGANIGTSVTNILVALGNVRIRRQFRRAFTAALIHDIFNWLTVAILFPIEWISGAFFSDGHGLLTRCSLWVAEHMGLSEIEKPDNFIKNATKWVVHLVESGASAVVESVVTQGVLVAVVGLALMFISLTLMVVNLKGALLRRVEALFRKIFFRNDLIAYTVGAITTVLVQSSSVTTSLIVPLAGAGAVKIRRVFPYTLGANLGTTMTGVIAATANPVAAAVTVSISHVSFNLIGTAIWYPMRRVPIGIARWYGRLASRSRRYAFLFLFGVFVVLPLVGLGISKLVTMILG